MTGTFFRIRMLPLYALAFLSGIAWLQCLVVLPDAVWIGFLPLVLLIGILRPGLKLPVVCMAGFLWALLHAHWYFLHVLADAQAGQSILIQGQITAIPQQNGRVQRFILQVSQYNRGYSGRHPTKLQLSWYNGQYELKSGQNWQLQVKLKPPHGLMNQGGFDYELWLYQNRIHATGYVKNHTSNMPLSTQPDFSIDRLRQLIVAYITAHTTQFSGLIEALAVGYKGHIPPAQWQALTRTGTSHLMAISGLHIGLIAAFVFWLVRRLTPGFMLKICPASQLASAVALLAAFIYALLAGFAIPTQRAMVMLAVVLGALLCRRQIKALNCLSWALMAVLLMDPMSIVSAGFWLSFMAVAVIAFCFSGRLETENLLLQWGRLQWVIALALFPVTLYLFQQTSLVAPVVNLFLVPWVSFIVVPLVLLASLALVFSTVVASWLYQFSEAAIALVWPWLDWISMQSFANWYQAQPPVLYVMFAIAGVMLLLAPKGFSYRWQGIIMLLPGLMYQAAVPDRGNAWVDVLDVGQGLAVVVQTQNHILVYDTGPRFSPVFDAGERVILPYLKYKGIRQLDKLIISHGDNDHIGGASSLISAMPITELWGQNIDKLDHPRKVWCKKGQSWRWDDVDFEILHPATKYKNRNNNGCVLRISNASGSVLLTADIESMVEEMLVENHAEKLQSDIMLVPHHGSKTSSTVAFINAVNPEFAIVSAGFMNRFKHPKPEIMVRYDTFGIKHLNTAEQGAIHFTVDAEYGVTMPVGYRKQAHHYWNHGHL